MGVIWSLRLNRGKLESHFKKALNALENTIKMQFPSVFNLLLAEGSTLALCSARPPAPCAPWEPSPPETAWRQRGSWEADDEVTAGGSGRKRRWGSVLILSAVNTVVLTEMLTCSLLKSSLEMQRNSEEFFSFHALKHI